MAVVEISDVFGLGKASEKLIDVISKGAGGLYRPVDKILMAKASAYELKEMSTAIAEYGNNIGTIDYNDNHWKLCCERSDLPQEEVKQIINSTNARMIQSEIKKQINLSNIIFKTQEDLKNEKTISNEPVDDDWATRFFKNAGDISNEKMQILWAKILAGEIKKPATYSLRALELLRNISEKEAHILEKVGKYVIDYHAELFFVLKDYTYYQKKNISFGDLLLLQDLGITDVGPNLSINASIGNNFFGIGGNIGLMCMELQSEHKIMVNRFTSLGVELLNLVDRVDDREYLKYMAKQIFPGKKEMKKHIGRPSPGKPDRIDLIEEIKWI